MGADPGRRRRPSRPPGPLTVEFAVESRNRRGETLELTANDEQGRSAIVVGTQDDGLARSIADGLGHGVATATALPRVRSATASIVEQDPRPPTGVASRPNPSTPTSAVVLSGPGPAPSGTPAEVSALADGRDRRSADEAAGGGYLVLADAIRSGSVVTVDGIPQPLVQADHAFGAVYVMRGTTKSGSGTWRGLGTGMAVTWPLSVPSSLC